MNGTRGHGPMARTRSVPGRAAVGVWYKWAVFSERADREGEAGVRRLLDTRALR